MKKNKLIFYNPILNQESSLFLFDGSESFLNILKDEKTKIELLKSKFDASIYSVKSIDDIFFILEFNKKRKFLKSIISTDFNVLDMVFKNTLIVVPISIQTSKVYFYLTNKEKENFYTHNITSEIREFDGVRLMRFKDKEYIVVDYERDAELFLSFNDALLFNEDIINNKNIFI